MTINEHLKQHQQQQQQQQTLSFLSLPNELDVHYKSLNCDLTLVDPSSHEYQMISKYTAATSSQWMKTPKILDVWRVDRHNVVSGRMYK